MRAVASRSRPGRRVHAFSRKAGSPSRVARRIESAVAPANGRFPVTSSYTMTPRAKTSIRASIGRPAICSGAMYPGVPATAAALAPGGAGPGSSAVGALSISTDWRASPKSRSLTLPAGVNMTFSGLRSRWTTPRAWSSASPSAIWMAMSTACTRAASGWFIHCRSVRPCTYSIATNETPSWRPTS
jgi:hypothetical protein